MRCPICTNKAPNCDCSKEAQELFELGSTLLSRDKDLLNDFVHYLWELDFEVGPQHVERFLESRKE
jgi:hypothetical protein